MRDALHSRGRSDVVPAPAPFGPRTLTLLSGCAATLSAYTLGAEWLAYQIAGIPLGMWLVSGAVGAVHAVQRRAGRAAASGAHAAEPAPGELVIRERSAAAGDARPTRERTYDLSGRAVLTGALELTGVPAGSLRLVRERADGLRRVVTGESRARRIRIGLDLAEADFLALTETGREQAWDGIEVEWVRADAGLIGESPRDCRAFDALVRRDGRAGSGDLVVFVPEHPGCPAAVPRWETSDRIGYATVFPPRVDTARCRLSGCDLFHPLHAGLVATATVAAALMGRSPARLGPSKRWFGRTAIEDLESPDGPLEQAMFRLSGTLAAFSPVPGEDRPRCVADLADALGAWASTREELCDGAARRLEFAGTAAALAGEPPEGLLRLGACQIAAGREADGVRTLARAASLLREDRAACVADPLPFLISEAELGSGTRLTLGRIAAGIALLCATAPEETLGYLRDDLLDDLRHAGWLSQRGGDLRLLQQVMDAAAGEPFGADASRPRTGAAA